MKSEKFFQNYCDVGKRIDMLMREKGISRKEMLVKLGSEGFPFDDRTFRNYLNGNSNIPSDRLALICKALDCSADYILGFIQLPNHEATDIQKATGLSSYAVETLRKLQSMKTVESFDLLEYVSGFLSFAKANGENPFFVDMATKTISIAKYNSSNTDWFQDEDITEEDNQNFNNMIIAGLKGMIQSSFNMFTDDFIEYIKLKKHIPVADP